jgi:polar amino acid transport system substrate-binding protein
MKTLILTVLTLMLTMGNLHAEELKIILSPFHGYVNVEEGKAAGPIIDIMDAIIKETNYSYAVEIYPWARAYRSIINGSANTLMPHLIKNKKRANLVKWGDEIMPMDFWIVKKKDRNDINFTTIDEAKKYNFITVHDDATTQYLQEHGFENLTVITDATQSIEMLNLNRGDLIIQEKNAFFHMLDSLKIDTDDYTPMHKIDELSRTLCLAFSKTTNDGVIRDIKHAFNQIKLDGTYDKILTKWGITADTKDPHGKHARIFTMQALQYPYTASNFQGSPKLQRF